MESRIIEFLSQPNYAPLESSQLLAAMGLTSRQQSELQAALASLERSGRIASIKGNRFALSQDADLVPGRIRMNRQGKGFLQPDDSNVAEVAVPEHATGTALNGDRVLVRVDDRQSEGQLVGKVIRILERTRTQLVGTLQRSKQFLYIIPDDPRIPHDIYVPEPRDVGKRPNVGDKVVVELSGWESRHVSPEGEIIEVLGPADQEGVDMLSVLRQYNLPLHFPPDVLAEARSHGSEIKPEDLAGRRDCREHQVITIDPDDAKDFDDAIYLEPAANQGWKLWVHIADVSHYVRPGTALDVEARKRGNSTYLVDRVIPMLPEALSNELCSLKPNVDRLTKCVEFNIAPDGSVSSTQFHAAVIRSQRRFSYEEALEVLQRPATNPIEKMLHSANRLAQIIRKKRFQQGSLALDFPETKIRLDDHGKVLRIERRDNDISHQLIEEYMLLANEAVAARLMALKRPSVYRIHEAPEERRLQEYRQDVMSHRIPCGNLTQRGEVQKLLAKLSTIPIGGALKIGFLRSLMRARYAVEPLGHYGLAKKKYTHFTSPIRRYADLLVHRSLFPEPEVRIKPNSLKEAADHISETERNSADAERDSKDVKMFAYLEAQLATGKPTNYAALVTDVRNFGFFVDVTDLGLSGAVPLSRITDDFYQFDQRRSMVVGRRSGRIIKLGDQVTVQVAKVDRFKKQIDFCLAPAPKRSAQQPMARTRTFDKPAPRTFDKPAPRTFDKPAPRTFDKPAPRTFDKPAPRTFDKPAPRTFDKPAPRTFDKPAPRTFDKPAPRTFDKPAPRTFDKPASRPGSQTAKPAAAPPKQSWKKSKPQWQKQAPRKQGNQGNQSGQSSKPAQRPGIQKQTPQQSKPNFGTAASIRPKLPTAIRTFSSSASPIKSSHNHAQIRTRGGKSSGFRSGNK